VVSSVTGDGIRECAICCRANAASTRFWEACSKASRVSESESCSAIKIPVSFGNRYAYLSLYLLLSLSSDFDIEWVV